ncbi:PKD domain-containing protein [Streptomyces sp. NPDC002120]|uniref:PKD domain-containing protein n=1 Tax=Streptomyces sp. NPDC002120 TaxID=3364631 RepID=UPI003682A256
MISAAVVAAAVGLVVPGAAHAAEPAANHTQDGGEKLAAAVEEATRTATFSSPPERSVRTTPAGSSAAKGAPTAAADHYVGLVTTGSGARTMDLSTWVASEKLDVFTVTVDWGDGQTATPGFSLTEEFLRFKHTYAKVGTHRITVTATDSLTKTTVTNSVDVVLAGSDFTPHAPTRLLDTRDGTGAPSAQPVAPYGTTRVKVGGNSGIPAGVTAVALNITATGATADGHMAAYASGTEQPTTSNVNFTAGRSVPNLAIVPVGADGYVELVNRSPGSVNLVADVTGYFARAASSGYTPMDPFRLVDTRDGQGAAKGQVAGQGSFGVQVAGQGGLPATGITAVALNVTITAPKDSGHLTVFPGGQQAPITSNVNFTAGQTVANSVIVPVGPDGRITVRNGSWSPTDVVVDVTGYYSADGKAAYLPVEPDRLHDSRKYHWPVDGQDYRWQTLFKPDVTLAGAVMNATVTNTEGSGHLTVAPDPNTREQYGQSKAVKPTPPNSSNLNWTKGETVSNLVQASAGKNDIVDFWNRGWERTDLVIDLFGVYAKN